MSCSVALCIPTYERPELVREFLDEHSADYIEAGIDIYYYDSSISTETEDLLRAWPDKEHVHYIKTRSPIKLINIFRQDGLEKAYDFLWMTNDSMHCSKAALASILNDLQPEYDMLVLSHQDIENIGKCIFADANELLKMCAWTMTLFGAVLMNCHTMLRDVDWHYYEEAFPLAKYHSWIHVNFYFQRILELKSCSVLHLSFREGISFSKKKKDVSWNDHFLQTAVTEWVKVIQSLPDEYQSKREASVKFGDYSIFYGGVSFLFELRRRKIYSFHDYFAHYPYWPMALSLSRAKLFLAAAVPEQAVQAYYGARYIIHQKRLEHFCDSFPKIYIYGAGYYGKFYSDHLRNCGIPFEGFCVTHRAAGQLEYCGKPVWSLREIKDRRDCGFLIGLSGRYAAQVIPFLKRTTGRNNYFFDPVMLYEIMYLAGYRLREVGVLNELRLPKRKKGG